MRMSNEHMMLKNLCLQEIRTHFIHWRRSDCTDTNAFKSLMKNLEFYFERFPEDALAIQRLVLSYIYGAQLKARPDDIERLAGFGLETGLMSIDDLHIKPAVNSLLSVSLAQSFLGSRMRFDGLDALIRADREAEALSKNSNIEAFIRANREFIRGSLFELGLEKEKATERFKVALAEVEKFLSDEVAFYELAKEWSQTFFGEAAVSPQFINHSQSLAEAMIDYLYHMSLLALGRVVKDLAQLEINFRDLIFATLHAASGRWGSFASNVYDVNAIEIVQVLRQLESHISTEIMLGVIGIDMKTALDAADYPQPVAAGWNALLSATAARFYDAEGKSTESDRLYRQANRLSKICDSNLIKSFVAGDQLLYQCKTSEDIPEDVTERFLQAIGELAESERSELPPLRVKALLDESTSAAIGLTYRKWREKPTSSDRVQLSALLDSLRQPGWIKSPLSKRQKISDELGSPASQGLWYAADRIQRLTYALKNHPQTAVIVIQYLGENALFICLTAENEHPVISEITSPDYQKVSRGLSLSAVEEVYTPFFGIESAAREAYNALPEAVRRIIEEHNILLLVPDFRTDDDSIPFELFHNGDQYLGIAKIIARLPSLAVATRILEEESYRQAGQRAFVFEAANVEGYPQLKFAKDEVEALHAFLRELGWRIVSPREGRLTKDLLLDHLETSDLLHIAAHGDTLAGDAALVLPQYQRLVADDILRNRFPKMPFIYLNTCLLGETQYLGGGVSKGLAYSLLQSGAPAVVANLAPVDDRSSLKLSLAFYRNAAKLPVGEALRKAREDLAQEGIPAPFLGMTVLMGNPDYSLFDGHKPTGRDPQKKAKEILIAVTKLANDFQKLTGIYQGMRESQKDSPYNARAEAALNLMESHIAAGHLSEDERLAELEKAALLAEEVGYLPALATTQISITEQVLKIGNQEEKALALDKALILLDQVVRRDEPLWEQSEKDYLRAKQMEYMLARQKLGLQQQGLTYKYSGDQDTDDRATLEDFHNIFLFSEMQQEKREGKVVLIDIEETLWDIAWNAIAIDHPTRYSSVIADNGTSDSNENMGSDQPSNLQSLNIVHPTRFSNDMRATGAVAEIVAGKLINRGYLPDSSTPYAGKIMSTVILYLWNEQGSSYRNRELMDGWTEGLVVTIEDIARQWSPPTDKPWFNLVSGFPARVEAMLTFVSNTPYSQQGYQQQLEEIAALQQEAIELIQRIEHEYPQASTGCGAYILGTLLANNIFYNDYRDKHLRQVYAEVRKHVSFGPYIKAGFERSGERKRRLGLNRSNLEI
jgi:CHAT domain-containing protein